MTFDKNQEFLNEIYIGKKPVDRLFQLFCQLRDWVLEGKGLPHREKFYKELCDEMCNVFGFGSVTFDINSSEVMNAMTAPVRFHSWAITHDTDLFLIDPKKHIKVNPKLKLPTTMIIYKGLMKKLTAEEFFAVLLHEIGHSFNQVALYAYCNKAKIAKIEANKQIKNTVKDVEKKLEKEGIRWVQDLRIKVFNEIQRIKIDEIITKTPLFHLANLEYKINGFFNSGFILHIKNSLKTVIGAMKLPVLLNPTILAPKLIIGMVTQYTQGAKGLGEEGFG